MKKYNVAKWLLLITALFTVACFFTPFAYGAWTSGLTLGYEFIIGAPSYVNLEVETELGIWLSRISLIVSVAAVVLAVIPLVSKNDKGLNKQGKLHKTLIVSVALSLLSASINLIAMFIGGYDEFYTFIGLICVVVLLIPVIILNLKFRTEISTAKVASQPEYSDINEVSDTENTVEKAVVSPATVSASQNDTVSDGSKKSNPIGKFMSGAGKFIKGLVKGFSRANKTIYGDLEGPMTKLKSGRRPISIENGKCIAWIVGQDDIVLSKENVKGLELTCEHKEVAITNCGGATSDAAIYTITMRNGEVGTLRLKSGLADYVLLAIAAEQPSATTQDGVAQTTKQTTSGNDPIGKPLEWSSTEAGLEVYKTFITPQNYMLEEFCKEEHKKKCADADFDTEFLPVYHSDAKLPRIFFGALIDSLNVEPLRYVGPSEVLIKMLEDFARPYAIDEDGEPVLRNPILTPEQIVSVEKNPVLNFVKNFNVFELKDDVVGTQIDKFNLYKTVLIFISTFVDRIVMEENQWLFDKNTYLNDFGTVRKEKGFLKKCKEMTDDALFIAAFDQFLSKLN